MKRKIKTIYILLPLLIIIPLIGGYYIFVSYQNRERETHVLLTNQQKALHDAQQQITDIQKNNEVEKQVLLADQKKASEEANQKIADIQKGINAEIEAAQNKIANTQNIPNQDTAYSNLVAEWQNRVAQVKCTWIYTNGSTAEKSGSATLSKNAQIGLVALTNNHVISDSNGNSPYTCIIGIYGIGARTVFFNTTNSVFTTLVNAGLDVAFIKLSNPASANDKNSFDAYAAGANVQVCDHGVNIGDKIIILGYPYDGSPNSITVTQGIVSGEDGNYWVTDAKIDHGNSGGAAILVKNGCWLGIPSASYIGQIESYGRILKASVIP